MVGTVELVAGIGLHAVHRSAFQHKASFKWCAAQQPAHGAFLPDRREQAHKTLAQIAFCHGFKKVGHEVGCHTVGAGESAAIEKLRCFGVDAQILQQLRLAL